MQNKIEIQFLNESRLLGMDLDKASSKEDLPPFEIPGAFIKWVDRPAELPLMGRLEKINLLKQIASGQTQINDLRPAMYVVVEIMGSKCWVDVAGNEKQINLSDLAAEVERVKTIYPRSRVIVRGIEYVG